MSNLNGVHHLAITTRDMKGQLDFFCNVLGGELRALYWMHGVEGAQHGFVRLNDHSYIAFVQLPADQVPDPIFGVTHAGWGGSPTARGAMQHVAFNVDSLDDLLAMRDRIRSHGVPVLGPIDHGMCQSMYFAGPDNLSLEVATSAVRDRRRALDRPRGRRAVRHRRRRARRAQAPRADQGPRHARAAAGVRPGRAEHDLPEPRRRTCGRSPRRTR